MTTSARITPNIFRRYRGVNAARLNAFSNFWSQICPPTQFTLDRIRPFGGMFGYLNGEY